MRKVELRMNEEYKYKIIKKLVETNGNKQRAAIKLKRSVRQIDRMIAGYKEHGKEFFVHGNRGRKPKNALTDEFKTEIEKGGFILAHWDGTTETEEKIKEETKATIRCIPFDGDKTPGKCMVTGKPSACRVIFARSY